MTREQQVALIGLLWGWLKLKKRECADPRTQVILNAGHAAHWIQLLDITEEISWKDPAAVTFIMKDGCTHILRFEVEEEPIPDDCSVCGFMTGLDPDGICSPACRKKVCLGCGIPCYDELVDFCCCDPCRAFVKEELS